MTFYPFALISRIPRGVSTFRIAIIPNGRFFLRRLNGLRKALRSSVVNL